MHRVKSYLLILSLICFMDLGVLQGQSRRPKVGLILEGGGALGFAHVGVLRVLEEHRIPVDLIAGTSMGSIVGAAYASGATVEEMARVLSSTDWDELFNETVPRPYLGYRQKPGRDREIFGDTKIGLQEGELVTATALVHGQKIMPLFQDLFGKVPTPIDFDDLPIPYRAVAADIETGEAVVIGEGNLALAARASMSVPGFFSPVEIENRLLVDGGITNNFPVDVGFEMGAEIIIGVEFGFEPKKRDQLTGPLGISKQILDLLLERTSARTRAMLRPQDIMIQPDVSKYTSTSFTYSKEIMLAGEEAARKLVPRLKKYAVSEEEFRAYSERRSDLPTYAPLIDYVRVEAIPPHREAFIKEGLTIKTGKPLDRREIEKNLESVHQTGDYKLVTYDIETKDGKQGVVIKAEEKEWLRKYLRLGFALEDDFDGNSNYSLAAEGRIKDLNSLGAYADIQGEIGRSPRLFGELYQPLWEGSRFFVAPDLTLSRQELRVRRDQEVVAEYEREVAVLGLKGGISFKRYGELYAGWRRGPGKLDRQIGESSLPEFDYDIGEFVTGFTLDQVDNVDFPTVGYLLSALGTASREDAGSNEDFEQGRATIGVPLTSGNNTLLLGAEGGYSSDDLSPERSYALGGFFDISGFTQNSLVADNYWVGRAKLYRRVSQIGSSLFKFSGYIGGSFEYASLRTELEEVGDNPDIVAGSLFVGVDTPLLPLYIGFGVNDESENSVYLALGRLGSRRR